MTMQYGSSPPHVRPPTPNTVFLNRPNSAASYMQNRVSSNCYELQLTNLAPAPIIVLK
jgi:hypothetical protein